MNRKVKEDVMPQALQVLDELVQLSGIVNLVRASLAPYTPEMRKKYRTLPQYIIAMTAEMNKYKDCLKNFSVRYPGVSKMVANGSSETAGMTRLYDGIYKLGRLNTELEKRRFAVKLDADRAELYALACHVLADLAVFTITQYRLDHTESEVYLSVTQYCEANMISIDVLYGMLLQCLTDSGETPYGYESISPYRDKLLDMDAVFVSECEDHDFPLTSDICEDLLNGKLDVSEARGKLYDWMKQIEQKTVEGLTPSNMLSALKLD